MCTLYLSKIIKKVKHLSGVNQAPRETAAIIQAKANEFMNQGSRYQEVEGRSRNSFRRGSL